MIKRLIASFLLIAALVNAQWATSTGSIPLSSNLSGLIDGKPNYQLSGTSGCAAVNGTIGKDICTDSAGKVYVPSVTGTPATWVQIPGNALQVNGAAVPASQTCVGTNSSSQIVTASCGGGGGVYAASQGPTASITETGSPVVVYSQASVPALAANSCYRISYATYNPGNAVNEYLYIDSTQVAQLQNTGGTLQWLLSDFLFCNATSSQTTQTITFLNSAYNASGTGVNGNFTAGSPYPAVTSVNMATTHTFSIRSQQGSGATQGMGFRIGQ